MIQLSAPDVSVGRATTAPAIILTYSLEERVTAEQPGMGRVERWLVSVLADQPGGRDHLAAIGFAKLIVLNPGGASVGTLADAATGDWVDGSTPVPGILRAANAETEVLGDHVVILDRLWIEPAWRGGGLGPIVATAAILRLSRGCRFVACYPAPFEPTEGVVDRAQSIAALGNIWAKVGFRLWDDGVWVLDLAATDLHASLQTLLGEGGG